MDSNLITTCPFFIVIIILIHAPVFLCQDNQQYVTCGESFQCGNIQDIGYPFWGQNRPEYCGHRGFQLNCQGDVPLITIMNRPYRVLDINSTTQYLTIARQDLSFNMCPTFLYNTTLDFTLFNYASSSSNEENLILHYGCTEIPGQTQPVRNQFDCTVNDTTSISYSVMRDSSNANDDLVTCNNSIFVPINQTSVQALSNTTYSISDLRSALSSGFALQWTANNIYCSRCVQSGGRCGQNPSFSLFACYCANQPYSITCAADQTENGSTHWLRLGVKLAIGLSVGVSGIIIILSFAIITYLRRQSSSYKASWAFWKKENIKDQNVQDLIRIYGSLAPKRYNYAYIKKMTNSYSDKLGQGGYGSVYKGKLPDGRLVAVKVLTEAKGNGEEFINEVASISTTSHVNVVNLLGFCYQGNKRALIYEFMPNGSLDKFISNNGSSDTSSQLDWKTLYQISVGIARGLEYLHRGCNIRIVHFDIKPHNILLDEEFCPKISDFGLAKLCQRKESILSLKGARGTIGYIAPEVFLRNFGGVSHKSDVYSYGMMVLEMAGARKKIEVGEVSTSEMYFPDGIYKYLELGENIKLDGVESETEEEETMRKMILVSLWCIQINPSDRPSISKVLEMLEGSLQSLQIPPKPSLFSPTMSCGEVSSLLSQNLI